MILTAAISNKIILTSVVPTKSESDVIMCLQSLSKI